MADQIPQITALASFLDALLYMEHKMHTAPNAVQAKKRIAKFLNLPTNIGYSFYAGELGVVLADSGKEARVKSALKSFGYKIVENENGLYEAVKIK
jgi:hypothetical protein